VIHRTEVPRAVKGSRLETSVDAACKRAADEHGFEGGWKKLRTLRYNLRQEKASPQAVACYRFWIAKDYSDNEI
jgi:hypothetical protein